MGRIKVWKFIPTVYAGTSANFFIDLEIRGSVARFELEVPDNYPTVRPGSWFYRYPTVYPRLKKLFAPKKGEKLAISYALKKRLSLLSKLKIALYGFGVNIVAYPRDLVSGVRTEYEAIGSQSTIRMSEELEKQRKQAEEDARRDLQLKRRIKSRRKEYEAREKGEPHWTPKLIVEQEDGEGWAINVREVRLVESGETVDPLLKDVKFIQLKLS